MTYFTLREDTLLALLVAWCTERQTANAALAIAQDAVRRMKETNDLAEAVVRRKADGQRVEGVR